MRRAEHSLEQQVELINTHFLKVNMGDMKVAWEPGARGAFCDLRTQEGMGGESEGWES